MNKHARPPKGFALPELIAVVALLAILGTGALLGLRHGRENVSFRKVATDLNAIDLAKQAWQSFHPGIPWPVAEPNRWSAISNSLGAAASGSETPAGSGYFRYPGFTPDGFSYHLGELTNAAAGLCGVQLVIRPR